MAIKKPTPIEIKTKDGRLIGILKGMVLHKRVVASKHMYRKVGDHGSWGIDYDVLFKQLPERGAVHINDIQEHILYTVKVARWKEYGSVMHFQEDSIDHYVQCFLPLEYFDKVRNYGG